MNKYHGEVIFILSAGKSGSTSLVRYFKAHGINVVQDFHKGKFSLLPIEQYPFNPEKEAEVIEIIKKNRILKYTGFTVDSTVGFYPIIKILNDIFPNSKFIHLVRNAGDQIRSALTAVDNFERQKQMILSGLPAKIKNYLGGKSDFERQCFYWMYINQQIHNGLQIIPEDRKMYSQLADWKNGGLQEIFDFAGVKLDPSLTVKHHNQKRRPYTIPHFDDWDNNMNETLDKYLYMWSWVQ
jgi:hypothetical protein